MRKRQLQLIQELINSIHEMHEEIKICIEETRYEDAIEMLTYCQEAAVSIGSSIEKANRKVPHIISDIEYYCESLYQSSLSLNNDCVAADLYELLEEQLVRIKSEINANIIAKYEIVFLPYKASMWDAFESIWIAAREDNNCECYVIPIPYYDKKNDGTLGKRYYEGADFPSYVPIVNYCDYNIEQRQPDIIYIHNPYDNNNTLTTISPEYYSNKLRKNTTCLVYTPYFVYGTYQPHISDIHYLTSASIYSNIIVTQSEITKRIYEHYGFNEEKVIATGLPKIDYVVNMKKSDFEMPQEWKGKIHTDRRVLLFNMHLSYYLKAYAKVKEGAKSNYALNRLEEMLPKILNNDKYSLIWRPHPLMKQMIISRLGIYPKELEEIEETIKSSNNAVIDINADYRYGFYFADAMISTFSSMVSLFSVLGKPIYIYQTRLDRNVTKDSPVDYDVFYYRHGKNRTDFKTFLNYLDNGEDPLYEDRMKVLSKSFVNMDGGAGEKIHKTVIDYCNSEQGGEG